MTAPTPLSLIIAYARAGALDLAWDRFIAAGHDRSAHDPGALSVKGRLLKDRALTLGEPERGRRYAEAAAAYRSAAALNAATYPLINAATLSLLAGDDGGARRLAEEVLEKIEQHPEEPETPYYRAATRAEALLLLRREEEAREAFVEAIALAPRAWEDHASTLRQFALILDRQKRDAAWLDAHRPPRSLHFGGHMSFHPEPARPELVGQIAEVLEEERIGFGYGALAAGADIIVAETLLERGAELHVVLPGGVESFAALSVDPYGEEWRGRFDAALARAESVRPVRPLGVEPDDTMIELADEIAMGAALMNARRLESKGVQLLILEAEPDEDAANGASGRAKDLWVEGGWHQRIMTAPREGVAPGVPAASARPWRRLAILAVAVEEPEAQAADIEQRLAVLQGGLAALPAPAVGPYLSGGQVMLAYPTALDAALAAARLIGASPPQLPLRIGGHYGVAHSFRDPFAGAERLAGDSPAAAAGALASALPGTAYIGEDFAAALRTAGPDAPDAEYVGELDPPDGGPPIGLFALKPRS